MSTAALAVTVTATALFAGAAIADFTRASFVVEAAERVGVSGTWIVPLGVLKGAGAAGLVIGLVGVTPIGIAAGLGLTAYFIGAVLTHLRAGDLQLAFPFAFLGVAAAALLAQLVG